MGTSVFSSRSRGLRRQCGIGDHKHTAKPGRGNAGRLGCAGQRGDVSRWSDHTNPFLLATFSHEERLALEVEVLSRPDSLALFEQRVRNAPQNMKSQWRCCGREREETHTSYAFYLCGPSSERASHDATFFFFRISGLMRLLLGDVCF